MTAKNIRFYNNNFMNNSFTFSSEQASFPGTNVINTSRSKVWKPNGNFQITALNNFLYINDGVDKSVELEIGAYNKLSLASHIQTQLNAASSNWTCTYDNSLTYRFTINRTVGVATLRTSVTTNAVWDTLGFTGSSDLVVFPFVAQEQRNHTSEWIQCDLGVPQAATFGGIIGGIDKIFTPSSQATIKIKANNIDFWLSAPLDISMTLGQSSALTNIDDISTDTYRYWRIEIIDRMNYLGPEGIEFAYAYIGDHLSMSLTNYATGFEKELTDPSNILQSENGALFFEKRPRYMTLSGGEIQLINLADRQNIEQLFYDIGTREPLFLAIDPGQNVTDSLEELTRYMVITKSPSLKHVIRDYYNISLDMREAF